jgi:nucleoside 2-deoxyribosyltransferase
MSNGIYIAGKFQQGRLAKWLHYWLQQRGFSVTSRWYFSNPGAQADLEDIEAADFFVMLPEPKVYVDSHDLAKAYSGGRHVEFGYAMARGKMIIMMGEPTNVFQSLLRERNVWEILRDAEKGGSVRRSHCGIPDAVQWSSGQIRIVEELVRVARSEEGFRATSAESEGDSPQLSS